MAQGRIDIDRYDIEEELWEHVFNRQGRCSCGHVVYTSDPAYKIEHYADMIMELIEENMK